MTTPDNPQFCVIFAKPCFERYRGLSSLSPGLSRRKSAPTVIGRLMCKFSQRRANRTARRSTLSGKITAGYVFKREVIQPEGKFPFETLAGEWEHLSRTPAISHGKALRPCPNAAALYICDRTELDSCRDCANRF
jgi:hypothetical protein